MDIKQKLNEVKEWLQKEYAGIRTGKSSPALLDSIRVESYGSLMPVNQVANISTEDARTLRVSPWDSSMISAIERAIQDADLGVSLATDSSGVRVIFPELTIERRAQLQKLAKSKLEDARIRVRSVRDDVMKNIDKSEKDGDISEDQKFTQKDAAQKAVDETNRSLESLFDQKEVELKK
jgi:ribosome recycling factor